MQNISFKITNAEILLKLQDGKFTDWEYLYDNFSPIMYGAILQLTDCKETANQILLNAFSTLKTSKFIGISLIACLIKYTKTLLFNILIRKRKM